MKELTLGSITSKDELRARSVAWDDLWWRSDVCLPTCRAETLALWLEHFEPQGQFHALTVSCDKQLVAALPLLVRRWRGLAHVARLPNNPWCIAGELLIDPTLARDACELLAAGLRGGPWSLAMLEEAALASERWQLLFDALEWAGSRVDTRLRFQIGEVEIAGDWSAYEASRSKNHRKHVRQMGRRLEEQGPTMLITEVGSDLPDWEALLHRGCDIENRGWKGEAGSSILRTPGMFDFYLRLVRQLAAWGAVEIDLLTHQGADAAFQLVYRGKGTLFPAKIAYDPELAKFSPWHVLEHRWLENVYARHAQDVSPTLVDFCGPLIDATARWSTRTYVLGKASIEAQGRRGAALFDAVRWAKRVKSKWRPEAPAVLPEIHPLPLHAAPAAAPGGSHVAAAP